MSNFTRCRQDFSVKKYAVNPQYSTTLIQHSWKFSSTNSYYHIFRPIVRALSIQKRYEIIKNEHARYTLQRFPTDNACVICTKNVSENTVLCIKHNFQLKLVCSIHSVALLNITLFKSKKFFIANHPSYLSGPMDTKKSRYSSPVDHRSLDDLWPQITRWSVHKYIHVTKVVHVIR
jgi:hypothetical protein